MDRRDFLQRAGVGLAAVSLPGWMQACHPRSDSPPADGEPPARPAAVIQKGDAPRSTTEALVLATSRGRPLLVFVVPTDPRARLERGELFGVYLNRADEEAMADLALCDIWCATADEMKPQVANAADRDAALAILIETDNTPAHVVKGPAPADLPEDSSGRYVESARVDAANARIAFLYARLHEVIAPDKAALRRRARNACAAVFPDRALMEDESARRELPNAQFAELVPAWVRWCAEDLDPASRKEWMKLLSDRAEARWRSGSPPRARWARATGCGGPEIEGDALSGQAVPCGTGYTPAYSARFLTFFTEERG